MEDPDPRSGKIWRLLRAAENSSPPSTFGFEARMLARLRQKESPAFWNLAFKLSPAALALILLAALILPSQIHDLEELVSLDHSINPVLSILHD